MRVRRHRMARMWEFAWPIGLLALAAIWFGDAVVNKLFDGEYTSAIFQTLLSFVVLRYARRGWAEARRSGTAEPTPLGGEDSVPASTYSTPALRALGIAERRAKDSVLTRRDLLGALQADDELGVWTRWSLQHPPPGPVGDSSESVPVVVNPNDEAQVFLATSTVVSCLETAERITRSYSMEFVHPGHLAAALAFSINPDPVAAGELLRLYFGAEFNDLDNVLHAPNTDWAPPRVGHLPPPTDLTRMWVPASSETSLSDIGRWAYPVLACFVMLSVAPLLASTPRLIEYSTRVSDAESFLRAGDLEAAETTLDSVLSAYPDSIKAMSGHACIAARRSEFDTWASHTQMALFAGMQAHAVGQCLPATELGKLELVRTGAGGVLRIADEQAEAEASIRVRSAATETQDDAIAELAQASCVNGSGGYPVLAGSQAFVALSWSLGRPSDRATRASLARCIGAWPDSGPKSVVQTWLGSN